MRIALFSPTIDFRNGYGNITFELCSQYHTMGIDFTLFIPMVESELCEKLQVPFAVSPVLQKNIFRLFQREGWKYFTHVNVSAFDIVHSLFAFPFCIPACRSARKYGKRFIMGAQGTYGVLPLTQYPERWFLKKCYRAAQSVTVPSAYTKEQIFTHAKEEYPITIIHNGVHFDRFQKEVDTSSIRERYADKKILLTVGGLKERKGQDLVLRALPKVLERHPDTVYVLVGDGNWKTGLKELAETLGIRDAVDFAGSKTGDELVAYFRACDVYVHTPKVVRLNFEGFGIVYLEASACRKPIVATDAGGIRDAVMDNETGLIVSDGDVEGIASSILTLLDDTALAGRLGDTGWEYAKEHSWTAIAHKYASLYGGGHE